jgi:hypothetical protein
MPDILSDYARRAAIAFQAAADETDAAEASRHRIKGYKLVALIRQREEALEADLRG